MIPYHTPPPIIDYIHHQSILSIYGNPKFMSEQLDLFNPGMNALITGDHRKANSREAHEDIKDHKVVHHEKILKALHELNGSGTSPEIAEQSGLEYMAVVRRMSELEADLKVIPAGKQGKYTKWRLV